ncbi:hypothetical protein TWF102_012028 [Orbilia oligospora]|uniref:Uncharacterized protein n=1 Tax=Orbilia oligospora TaxID=2813651 RepID=A0A7C8NCB4_ORBOL|nr:hypothetical protein TWF706_002026 [Orbilia oligospora]KAF3090362.1 hypothetical protein TWF102_012028 [Orbilia oligospora]KAF3102516.1 hypothetical protein TWF103_012017 [Orbilia oligospora]KAF3141084.1 hypothetical protein TWF594_006124 [Orbilia oligospora]
MLWQESIMLPCPNPLKISNYQPKVRFFVGLVLNLDDTDRSVSKRKKIRGLHSRSTPKLGAENWEGFRRPDSRGGKLPWTMVRSRLVRLAPAHRREKSTFKYFGRPPQSKPKIAWQKRGSHKSNFRGIQIARGGYIQANRLQKRKMNRTLAEPGISFTQACTSLHSSTRRDVFHSSKSQYAFRKHEIGINCALA